jgi:hypothetical protein
MIWLRAVLWPLFKRVWPAFVFMAIQLSIVYGAYNFGMRVERGDQAQQLKAAVVKADKFATLYEQEKVKKQARTRVITKEIVREVIKPIYTECVVPPSGVRLANAARSGQPLDPMQDDPALE